jgi:DNA ligase 1
MAKKSFLMLAHKYDLKKDFIPGWYLSTKLDGIRAFYDGGITKGMPANQIPWANVDKHARLRDEVISTGLWSRYGQVIRAPEEWLNKLPSMFLDGELWINNNAWQSLSSIIKRFDPNPEDWSTVKFMIIDSPPIEQVFGDGEINESNYKKTFKDIPQWINNLHKVFRTVSNNTSFEHVYHRLKNLNIENNTVKIHEQIQLPINDHKATIEQYLKRIIEGGGEGIVLREPYSRWECCRSHSLLKYKSTQDAEAIVTGYVFGKKTDLGSKYLGRMGSIITLFKGKRLEVAGFTDQERVLVGPNNETISVEMANELEGKDVPTEITNPSFPRGSIITIRFRELSDGNIPKECRFLRKFENI